MAKEKDTTLSKEERKAARKAAKAAEPSSNTLTEPSGISKSKTDKKDKKEKKEKKAKAVEKLLEDVEKPDGKSEKKKKAIDGTNVDASGDAVSEDEDVVMDTAATTKAARPIGALVPFANPLADEKVGKKVFRGVKKAAAQRTLKRGVKEVVKALRKSPTTTSTLPPGLVVLAADISPMDVISHIPVLCEDHNIPYIYVTSRAELGMAGQTKRPTSVVMIARDISVKAKKAETDGKKKKEGEEEDGEAWEETFKALVKVVEREGRFVKI